MLWLEPPLQSSPDAAGINMIRTCGHTGLHLEQCAQILDTTSTAFGWALVRSAEHLKNQLESPLSGTFHFRAPWAGSRDGELPLPAIA
jgi:hypothetical protein